MHFQKVLQTQRLHLCLLIRLNARAGRGQGAPEGIKQVNEIRLGVSSWFFREKKKTKLDAERYKYSDLSVYQLLSLCHSPTHLNTDGTHARTTTAVRNAECLVQIEMRHIGAGITRAALKNL